MKKQDVLNHIHEQFVIGVVRTGSAEEALTTARAFLQGGVRSLEISAACPRATQVISRLKEEYGDSAAVGAGTVLDPVTARVMMLAGADYIAAPSLDQQVAEICHLYQTFYMPACYTSNEIAHLLRAGLHVVKLFPGELFTMGSIHTLMKMYDGLEVIATGGVTEGNLAAWINMGLFSTGLALPGASPKEVEARSRSLMERVQQVRAYPES